MKNQSHRFPFRTVFAAAMALSAVLTICTFVTVKASGDDVTPTDNTYLSEQTKTPVIKTAQIKQDAPDLMLSSMAGRNGAGTKFKRFLPSASYNGSYRSELDDNEKKLYDGLRQAFVDEKKTIQK